LHRNSTESEDELTAEDLDNIAERTIQRCELNDKSLRALDVSDCVFTSSFFSLLGEAMQHNTVLQELYLDACHIDDQAVRVLSRGIEQNTGRALRVLSLEDNQIKCVGVGHLARLLRGRSRWARTFGGYRTHATGPGKGIQYLSLKGNAMSAIGCKALAEALSCSDDSLERLSLEANRIDDWGAGWFAQAIKNNNVLQCLDLHKNPIGTDGIEELKNACESANASLVLLRVKCLQVGDDINDEAHAEAEADFTRMNESEEVPMVTGQRFATVYVSEAGFLDTPSSSGICSAAASRPGSAATSRPGSASRPGAYSRPGSAKSRQGQAHRRNGELDIDEPSGPVMANSVTVNGMAGTSELSPHSTKVSAAGLSCGIPGGDGSGALRRSARRARPLGQASTYSLPVREAARIRQARPHSGERTACAEETETATGLAPPSRWRRKLGAFHTQKAAIGRPSLGGCGASAARGLRRSHSTPGARHGMLMGPHAATGVYGCSPIF
jgi:hypothetical protein